MNNMPELAQIKHGDFFSHYTLNCGSRGILGSSNAVLHIQWYRCVHFQDIIHITRSWNVFFLKEGIEVCKHDWYLHFILLDKEICALIFLCLISICV
jgi:hypothetical protein